MPLPLVVTPHFVWENCFSPLQQRGGFYPIATWPLLKGYISSWDCVIIVSFNSESVFTMSSESFPGIFLKSFLVIDLYIHEYKACQFERLKTVLWRKKKCEVKQGFAGSKLCLGLSSSCGVSASPESFYNFHCMNYPSFLPINPLFSDFQIKIRSNIEIILSRHLMLLNVLHFGVLCMILSKS